MARKRLSQPFGADVVRRIRFEAEARRTGLRFNCRTQGAVVRYRFPIEVPVSYDERQATAVVGDSVPREANVQIDGPICVRHRFLDNSLCMWWGNDADEARWRISDGLLALSAHTKYHAWCEAECRASRPWPKEEAPGDHPRPSRCPTCAGVGA
jgi:hypothetical protein